MLRLWWLLLLGLLAGCNAPPAAKLQLVGVGIEDNAYAVTFDADVDFLGYYEDEGRFWPAVNKKLVCRLDRQSDFDAADYATETASGSLEFVAERRVGQRKVFRYKAHLSFEKWESGSSMSIGDAAYVDAVLPPGAAIACKVRILVYFAPRYLSETMLLPANAVKRLARQVADEEAKSKNNAGDRR
ncbi:hypothetical protein [Pseudoduganella chitinolytica]|uniref:Lipoprotein n=1 Tax=Pseudoduganella chitinolytica TaxID=34070 RepID=A0ABY8BFF1_9BURK|nr:hypothetical protein [Pseudoduganella chitinolytica]WEF34651.1 hypothetical protein PX653_07780 [Pseudoduganella chitinolytica]